MSINVTITANPNNFCRKRMVLTDLDQIKKNERDRRRRLRLEQVRQQSKEISNRLLERVKNVAKDELSKLERDAIMELKKTRRKKIMEASQKYQEDLEELDEEEDSLKTRMDLNSLLEEQNARNRIVAIKRGKDALEKFKASKNESEQASRQEKLRQVRHIENLRSSMIAELAKKSSKMPSGSTPLENQNNTNKIKNNKLIDRSPLKFQKTIKVVKLPQKETSPLRKTGEQRKQKVESPQPGVSGLQEKWQDSVTVSPTSPQPGVSGLQGNCHDSARVSLTSPQPGVSGLQGNCQDSERVPPILPKDVLHAIASMSEDDSEYEPRQTMPALALSPDKIVKTILYNPEDYTHDTSTTISKDSISDDSYSSDTTDECCRCSKIGEKLHHINQFLNTKHYEKNIGILNCKEVENIESRLRKQRDICAQRRGKDAILRERVRKDYNELLQNLDRLANDERKLKASQIHHCMDNVHLRPNRRQVLQEQQQMKLDRVVKSALRTSCEKPCTIPAKTITLPLREKKEDPISDSMWEQPPFINGQLDSDNINENEESQKEQILKLLQKIEKSKKTLLEEFGDQLPSNIRNASLKSLLDPEKKPLSPELKVIDMSSTENKPKPVKKRKCPSIKKVETAVQTLQHKGVQVEIPQENRETNLPITNVSETEKKQPIEPIVTVIRPEEESSSSQTSIITGVTIDINQNKLKVTPKKKRSSLNISKKVSPMCQKQRSLLNSKISPHKKLSKSMQKAKTTHFKKPIDSVSNSSNKIDFELNKSKMGNKINPEKQIKQVSITDSKTQTILETSVTSQEKMTQTKRITRIQETSDTSTSFASPPSVKPGAMIVESGITPILEMLDSSINTDLRLSRRDISPVSTPETPSPRTMRIPSNIPHPGRISKLLKFASSDSQSDDTILSSSSQYDPSLNTDESREICSCINPECKLIHRQLESICKYAENNPEIQRKYEDLKNMCSERIASLTELIDQLRNEQNVSGLDFSLVTDETKFMELPAPRPVNEMQTVRKLLENMEAIHRQLAETFIKSEKIITNNARENTGFSSSTIINIDATKKYTETIEEDTENYPNEVIKSRKPQIISDERVNIKLDIQRPQAIPPNKNSWSSSKRPGQDQKEIEKISNEILEQSKGLNESLDSLILSESSKDSNHAFRKYQGSSVNGLLYNNISATRKVNLLEENNLESNKENQNTRILVGIPKINRSLRNFEIGRPKPPATILSGPYRPEVMSPVHELSTIVEFDTPDTASNVRPSKSTESAKPESIYSRLQNASQIHDVKSQQEVKPSIHVAPLLSQNKVATTSDLQNSKEDISKIKEDIIEKSTKGPSFSSLNKDKIPSTSSQSFSSLSGISEITSTTSSEMFRPISSPEEIETALMKFNLGWALATLKKTREASALSSSSNSDITPMNTARRMISPTKKLQIGCLSDLSDVSLIPFKEASKSTEQAVLLRARTSTPNIQNSKSNSRTSNCTINSSATLYEVSDSLIAHTEVCTAYMHSKDVSLPIF
ncbi:uncharacterized protein [Prorops nasuta]|uniref:uncharacterized protein n=1 Tax=Prorops nasuta TaxID=863751 RepID=UPI0034CF0EB6